MTFSRKIPLLALGGHLAVSLSGCDDSVHYAPLWAAAESESESEPSTGGAGGGIDTALTACEILPQTGCPCAGEGEAVDCGYVVHREGDYVACSPGTMTCHDGAWGDCLGERYGSP